MNRALDFYFLRPVLTDYLLMGLVCSAIYYLVCTGILIIPDPKYVLPIRSDLTMVSLTSAGFILTLLTVFITFKSGVKRYSKNDEGEIINLFDAFFSTNLYFETVRHFKNCIKSLVLLAILGYGLKIGFQESRYEVIYFYNILALGIIILTLWRSMLILSKILHLQKDEIHDGAEKN